MTENEIYQRVRGHLKDIETKIMECEDLRDNKGNSGFGYDSNWDTNTFYSQAAYKGVEKDLLRHFPELTDKVEEIREEIRNEARMAREREERGWERVEKAFKRNGYSPLLRPPQFFYKGNDTIMDLMRMYGELNIYSAERTISEEELMKREDELIKKMPLERTEHEPSEFSHC